MREGRQRRLVIRFFSYGEVLMAKDPVCDESVDERRATANGWISEFEGQTHYFCSDDCKELFDQDPGQYIGPYSGQYDSEGEGETFDRDQG